MRDGRCGEGEGVDSRGRYSGFDPGTAERVEFSFYRYPLGLVSYGSGPLTVESFPRQIRRAEGPLLRAPGWGNFAPRKTLSLTRSTPALAFHLYYIKFSIISSLFSAGPGGGVRGAAVGIGGESSGGGGNQFSEAKKNPSDPGDRSRSLEDGRNRGCREVRAACSSPDYEIIGLCVAGPGGAAVVRQRPFPFANDQKKNLIVRERDGEGNFHPHPPPDPTVGIDS